MRGHCAYVVRTAQAFACAVLFCGSVAIASPQDRLGESDARHLLARTGFGPTADKIQAYARLTRAQAADRLLRETRDVPFVTP